MTFTKADYAYWEKARSASYNSSYKQFHIGCVAVYHGRIISMGWNQAKTHPVQRALNHRYRSNFKIRCENREGIHAEMACLLKLQRPTLDIDWSKVKLYIYRECFDGTLGMSKPCLGCETFIRRLGIKNIYYTVKGGYAYEQWR